MVFYFTSRVVDPPAKIYMGKDKYENEELIKYGWDNDVWFPKLEGNLRNVRFITNDRFSYFRFHVDKLSSAHVYLRLPAALPEHSGKKAAAPIEEAAPVVTQAAAPAPTPPTSGRGRAGRRGGSGRPAARTTPSSSSSKPAAAAPVAIPPAPTTWTSISTELLTDLAQLTKANSIEGNKQSSVTVIYTPWSNLRKTGEMVIGEVGFHDPKLVRRVLVPARENTVINRLMKTREERSAEGLLEEREEMLKERRKKELVIVAARQKEELRLAQERKQLKWQREHAYDELFSEEHMQASSNQDANENLEEDFM